MHEVVLIVIPFRRIVQPGKNNGGIAFSRKRKGYGTKRIVIDGDNQIGLRTLNLYQGEITTLPDSGFSGVQTFRAHIKMIENHTAIKQGTFSQGTLNTLKLRRSADMVRPVAVDNENPGGFTGLFHRRSGGITKQTKDKRTKRKKKVFDREKTMHEKIPAREGYD
jgi:hypothetical protein